MSAQSLNKKRSGFKQAPLLVVMCPLQEIKMLRMSTNMVVNQKDYRPCGAKLSRQYYFLMKMIQVTTAI